MKKQKILFSSGSFLLFGSLLLDKFIELPDFLKGFCMGLGITLMIGSLIVKAKMKREAGH